MEKPKRLVWEDNTFVDSSWSPVPVQRIRSNGTEPRSEPSPAELLVAAYVLAGMAMYLAWARLWRWW